MRSSGQYLILFMKGLMMGAADVVPGVSGGTIAFVSGIYIELINSIKALNLRALSILGSEGLLSAWQYINGNFLLSSWSVPRSYRKERMQELRCR